MYGRISDGTIQSGGMDALESLDLRGSANFGPYASHLNDAEYLVETPGLPKECCALAMLNLATEFKLKMPLMMTAVGNHDCVYAKKEKSPTEGLEPSTTRFPIVSILFKRAFFFWYTNGTRVKFCTFGSSSVGRAPD